jgi:hypothetical protein
MSLDQARALVRGLCDVANIEFIDITGGEPLLYPAEIKELAKLANERGKRVRVVSNGFWAASVERAEKVVHEMRYAGVQSIGISIDEWHLEHLRPELINNYVDGCRRAGMQPFVSCVVRGDGDNVSVVGLPPAVVEVLTAYGINTAECIDFRDWARQRREIGTVFEEHCAKYRILVTWQILTGEGRARNLAIHQRSFNDTPQEPCEAAGNLPTIDEAGRLFPCCSPWVSRKEHAFAVVTGGDIGTAIAEMHDDPLVTLIRTSGPKAVIDALKRRGVVFPEQHSGICNQCGMFLDRVPLEEVRRVAAEVLADRVHHSLLQLLGLGPKQEAVS